MQDWGALPFSPEAVTVLRDALAWEGGTTLLEGKVAWRMEHESEGSFLKQYLGDANQSILKEDIVFPISSTTLPRKGQLSISRPFYLHTCRALECLFLVQ